MVKVATGATNPDLDKLQPFKRDQQNRDMAATLREFLQTIPRNEKEMRKFDISERQTWFKRIVENVAEIASSKTHPLSVVAARALLEHAYGKPKPSDEELGAMKEGRFQLVYVNQATVDPDIIVEEARALPPQPDFVNAEFTDDPDNQPMEKPDAER